VAAIPWLALSRGTHRRRTTHSHLGSRELVRSKLAWAVAGYFGTQSLIAYVMFGWLPRLLQDNGYSSGQVGLVLTVFTGLAVPISFVVPALSARFADQRPMVVILAVLYAVGFAGLLTGQALWLWSLVVAVAMGTFPLGLSMLDLRTRTAEGTAGLAAFGQSVGYLIAGAGPLVFGVLYQLSGGWAVPFALLFVTVAAQVAVGWYAGANRVLEDERENDPMPADGGKGILAGRDAGHVSRGVRDRVVLGSRRRARTLAKGRRDSGGEGSMATRRPLLAPLLHRHRVRPVRRRKDLRSARRR
jgi:CP family cyanate transporter-like MFS transporter